MKLNIEEIPQGHIEGYLLETKSVGYKRPLHYFVLADDYYKVETLYHLPKSMEHTVKTYMGEYVCISKLNNKVIITPGGCPE